MSIGDVLFIPALIGLMLLGVWVGKAPSKRRIAVQVIVIALWVVFASTVGRHKLFILAACVLVLGSGCASYKNSYWTPDSLYYTVNVDHATGGTSSSVGLGWNLKP